MIYPGPINGDRLAFEIEHADTPPHERPDWPMPSFSAADWAAEFVKIATRRGYADGDGKPIDEAWMISWFAGALMRGYDEHAARTACAA